VKSSLEGAHRDDALISGQFDRTEAVTAKVAKVVCSRLYGRRRRGCFAKIASWAFIRVQESRAALSLRERVTESGNFP